jgi:CheY-like chemotaxis protein
MVINKSCLLVNEDPNEQAIFISALREVSPQTLCFTASDGIDALYMMIEDNLVPDYIFVELNMPGMDGLSFLREIKKIDVLKDIPVIVHTPSPPLQRINQIKEAGAKAIFTSDYTFFSAYNMLNLYLNDTFLVIHSN